MWPRPGSGPQEGVVSQLHLRGHVRCHVRVRMSRKIIKKEVEAARAVSYGHVVLAKVLPPLKKMRQLIASFPEP